MTFKPLIATKSFAVVPGHAGLKGFTRISFAPQYVDAFKLLYKDQSQLLYNHSPIYPFAYLNLGLKSCFVNDDWKTRGVIPVVQHGKNEISYTIYTPASSVQEILTVAEGLKPLSKAPVIITDVTSTYALLFTSATHKYKAIKSGDDVLQDTILISELKGRNFSSIRNALRHVEKDLQPEIKQLGPSNYLDAIDVFYRWKEEQGKKYFRVTIGRDVRLMDEYGRMDRIDNLDYFGYVYYCMGRAEAVSFGCRSWTNPEWGIDVTCKANIQCKGLGDFAFHHLMTEMHKQGIQLVNDSGCTTAGNKISKTKWGGGKGCRTVPMFNLVPVSE